MLSGPLDAARQAPRSEPDCPGKTSAVRLALPPQKATILCVDDDPDALAVLAWFLAAEGLEVVTACNGSEALLRVEELLPDIIITDYIMPCMTGLELCDRLRKSEKTRGIPIIVYTALRLPAHSGLYDRTFLKPTDFDVFSVEIRSLLDRNH
jgi:CheY-like chemotaxis protein